MKIESVRDLKLELALEVFAPIARDVLDRARRPRLGTVLAASPLQRVALGIARGTAPGEFSIAVRLQAKSALLQSFVDRIIAKAGREVDIGYIGRLKAFDTVDPGDPTTLRAVRRPLVIGCSLAHVASTAGTLGLIARHRKTGRTVLVSNSHVLAQGGQAKIGDGITQPGRIDGGGQADHVAALLDFAPFKDAGGNLIDAAIAGDRRREHRADAQYRARHRRHHGAGRHAAFAGRQGHQARPHHRPDPRRGDGDRNGRHRGRLRRRNPCVFDNRVEITGLPGTPFSDAGDSGSLVIDDQMRAIGLVFCGNPNAKDGAGLSYANHLPKVMAGLDLIPL